MDDEDIAEERRLDKRVRQMRALRAFLEGRGIDASNGQLYGRVVGIDNHLATFDHRETRRWALDQLERSFTGNQSPWARGGLPALGLWEDVERVDVARARREEATRCPRGSDAAPAELRRPAADRRRSPLDEPFAAFPSWFMQITCDRCGQDGQRGAHRATRPADPYHTREDAP
jgi:hypothetical protein